MKRSKNETDIRKYRHCKSETQKLERQACHSYINTIIEIGENDDDRTTKQKRFWNFIWSLQKDNTGILPTKDMGRFLNIQKDKATILNRQYASVHTHEEQAQTLSPSGTPYPDMDEIQVMEGVLKMLQKTNPRKATGPDSIPALILKDYAAE